MAVSLRQWQTAGYITLETFPTPKSSMRLFLFKGLQVFSQQSWLDAYVA